MCAEICAIEVNKLSVLELWSRENVRNKRKCEKEENRNKCADISLEISAIRCEIKQKMIEKM